MSVVFNQHVFHKVARCDFIVEEGLWSVFRRISAHSVAADPHPHKQLQLGLAMPDVRFMAGACRARLLVE